MRETEPDDVNAIYCSNCGEEMFFDQDICDECEEEEYEFEQQQLEQMGYIDPI